MGVSDITVVVALAVDTMMVEEQAVLKATLVTLAIASKGMTSLLQQTV